jgi:hypothetical protein
LTGGSASDTGNVVLRKLLHAERLGLGAHLPKSPHWYCNIDIAGFTFKEKLPLNQVEDTRDCDKNVGSLWSSGLSLSVGL